MRKLPEHTPRPDLWSKVQQRKDFDMQVKDHVTNLPERMPKADLWKTIENELDHKTPVAPLWKYRLAAASIVVIFVLSSIVYLQFGGKNADSPLVTEVNTKVPEAIMPEITSNTETEPETLPNEHIEQKELVKNTIQKQSINRGINVPIEFSKPDLADLSIENTFDSELIIPSVTEEEASQTLHKVRISWGIHDKSKLRTTFGSGIPEDISERQVGRVDETTNSIKIRLKKQ